MQCVSARRQKHKRWCGHLTQSVWWIRKDTSEDLEEVRFRRHWWVGRGKVF